MTPLDLALARVGDRWTLLVVDTLLDGPRRYGEVSAAIPAIAPNILAQRLKRLERDGLIVASPYTMRPPRYTYELTASGRELAEAVASLTRWAARHEGLPAADYHTRCGTALELRVWCPTCDEFVSAGESDDLERF